MFLFNNKERNNNNKIYLATKPLPRPLPRPRVQVMPIFINGALFKARLDGSSSSSKPVVLLYIV